VEIKTASWRVVSLGKAHNWMPLLF